MHGFVYLDKDGDLQSNLVITVINLPPPSQEREREREIPFYHYVLISAVFEL